MMNPPQVRAGAPASISVIGAGIAGTWQALMFAKAGCKVALYERSDASMTQATGHWAGGMLAPYCEGETAEYLITRLGLRSLDLWREALPDTPSSMARWWWRMRATAPISSVSTAGRPAQARRRR